MDNDIFAQVYKLYLNDIYMYVYLLCKNHQTAEDIAQETFIKAFLKLDFPDKRIKSWLLSVAHNIFIDYYRKNKKVHIYDDTILETLLDRFSLEEEYIAKEQLNHAIKGLNNLPLNQKRAVILSDFNGLSYIEKNGVCFIGAVVEGDSKELLKLKDNPYVHCINVENVVVW